MYLASFSEEKCRKKKADFFDPAVFGAMFFEKRTAIRTLLVYPVRGISGWW